MKWLESQTDWSDSDYVSSKKSNFRKKEQGRHVVIERKVVDHRDIAAMVGGGDKVRCDGIGFGVDIDSHCAAKRRKAVNVKPSVFRYQWVLMINILESGVS